MLFASRLSRMARLCARLCGSFTRARRNQQSRMASGFAATSSTRTRKRIAPSAAPPMAHNATPTRKAIGARDSHEDTGCPPARKGRVATYEWSCRRSPLAIPINPQMRMNQGSGEDIGVPRRSCGAKVCTSASPEARNRSSAFSICACVRKAPITPGVDGLLAGACAAASGTVEIGGSSSLAS